MKRTPFQQLLALALGLALPGAVFSAESTQDFTQMSLTELLQVRVTSVSRKEQSLSAAPASIFVISGDDIERLGATTISSALRLSPGVQVARIDSHELAVSARGFDDLYSNKLLVLVDGRTIYNQLFSGVFWNQNPIFMADIDHIEVIRGPGSTQWGANAVNGVISVNSKNARETLGTLLNFATGDQTEAFVELRHGWKLNRTTAARIYVKEQDESDYGINEAGASTGWRARLLGLRMDWKSSSGSSLSWITEGRETLVGNNATIPSFAPPYAIIRHEDYRVGSYMSLLKWMQAIGEDGTLTVQTYFDVSDRTAIKFGEDRTVMDFDAQLQLHPAPRHELVVGVGAREDRDRLTPSIAYDYSIPSDSSKIFSTFIQDEINLVPDKLKLSAGIKFEKGSLFGWEPQPSLRAVFTPSSKHSLWASFTRAARTPSRSERAMRMFHTVLPPYGQVDLPTAVFLTGTPGFETEHLGAFELGYRTQPFSTLSFDAAVYYNRYTHLRDINATPTGLSLTPVPHYTVDSLFTNAMKGNTYGAEISTRWYPISKLQFDATFTTIRYDLRDNTPILPFPAAATEGTTPRYQAGLKAYWSIDSRFSLNLFYSYRTALTFHSIPSYSGLDANLTWKATENMEIALIGQDLLDPSHPEFSAYFLSGPVRELARCYRVRVSLRF